MSEAKWCDLGNHAFPGNQPGATTLAVTEQVRNQWGGYQPTNVVQDVCAACARDTGFRGMTSGPNKTQEELDEEAAEVRDGSATRRFLRRGTRELTGPASSSPDSATTSADPIRTAELEGWQKGYQEAAEKFGERV